MKNDKKPFEDKAARVCYPFGHKGKRYTGQKTEVIECPKCKLKYEVTILESIDPDYEGYCHAANPSACPQCHQNYWYRDGFEKA
jgi:hypothetical protein